MAHHRGLVVTLVLAVLLGGAFIGVLAVVGDDPAPALTTRGFTHDVVNVQEDIAYHPFLDRYVFASSDPSGHADPAGH
jgi:hypothetical protein